MRILILVATIAFTFNFATAQNAKTVEKAKEKVEEIDSKIVSVNPELALSDVQKETMLNKLLQKAKDSKLIQKSDKSDEDKRAERKALNKSVFQQIHKEILSKEQRKAFTKANKKMKKEKQGKAKFKDDIKSNK